MNNFVITAITNFSGDVLIFDEGTDQWTNRAPEGLLQFDREDSIQVHSEFLGKVIARMEPLCPGATPADREPVLCCAGEEICSSRAGTLFGKDIMYNDSSYTVNVWELESALGKFIESLNKDRDCFASVAIWGRNDDSEDMH